MSKIKKNTNTKAYEIPVNLDWSDLMLIQQSLKMYAGNDIVRTQRRINKKLDELNNELRNIRIKNG